MVILFTRMDINQAIFIFFTLSQMVASQEPGDFARSIRVVFSADRETAIICRTGFVHGFY
jgi:hypothetical protein